MQSRNARILVLVVALLLLGSISIVLTARLSPIQDYGPLDKEFYLSDTQIAFIRPGLDLEILEAIIPQDRRPVIKFSIKDPKGLPLDRDGVFTPGPVSVSFVIGYLAQGTTQYTNYITRAVTSPITKKTVNQPSVDSGGTFSRVSDGVYTYTFRSALPADYDPNATHSVGAYARRDLTEFDLDTYVDNAVFHFCPSGVAVTHWRDVARTANCNQCHNPLALHGGQRREVALCVLCHTPQNTDPDTGNSVDFKVMIHKIHRGHNLPSVRAGTPYQIIGFRQRVFDFSDVAFPQDIRNCEKCHGGATQGLAHLLRPSAAACGSCHDDVDFTTGKGHAAGPSQDGQCATCHIPEGELEFDASVKGAHTIPSKSKQLKGLNVSILGVSNTSPGQNAVVLFNITENDGTKIAPASLPFFNLNLAGPTTDYSTLIRESARTEAVPAGGDYLYTFKGKIPDGAQGTFTVGAEAYRMVKLNPGTSKEINHRETAVNPVYYSAVTDGAAVPRRVVVATEKCNKCHEDLALHGTVRRDPSKYCVMCHIPSGTDEAQRPLSEWPPQSRHFKFMVHRIHTGHDLTRDFTIYGFGKRPVNFNELRFPGDRRDCETCHVNNSYRLPLPSGLLPTLAPREYFSPLRPATAACLGCHDSEYAAAHAYTMTAPFGEACVACHGTGAQFSVERVHAR